MCEDPLDRVVQRHWGGSIGVASGSGINDAPPGYEGAGPRPLDAGGGSCRAKDDEELWFLVVGGRAGKGALPLLEFPCGVP